VRLLRDREEGTVKATRDYKDKIEELEYEREKL
jgi:hypothetical protein